MSLDWNITNIKNHKELCWVERDPIADRGEPAGEKVVDLNPVTNGLIWATMSVGIGDLSEKNAGEFAARLRILQAIHGAELYRIVDGKKEDWYITDDDVIAHIGLSTNVFPIETRTKWMNRIVKVEIDRVKRDVERKLADRNPFESAA